MAKMCFSLVFTILVALSMEALIPPEDGAVLVDSRNYRMHKALSLVEMPDSCAGQSYCFDKGANYPDEKIKELLADMRELKVENPPPRTDLGNRYGDTYDKVDCEFNSTESPIFYITDIYDRVRVVVQSTEKFQQIYSVKWCLNEGQIKNDTPHFLQSTTLKNFKMECVSTKMDFQFFVLSEKVVSGKQKLMMEPAMAKGGIPVCCRCRYDAED